MTTEPHLSPSGSLPIPRSPRYRSLDLWRGLACVMVVMVHSKFYAPQAVRGGESALSRFGDFLLSVIGHMGVGVPLFFVISGYCIAATSDATRRKPGAMKKFFFRRFHRIFPPYWSALLLAIALIVLCSALWGPSLVSDANHPIPQPSSLTAVQWLGNITLIEQWRPTWFGSPPLWLLNPAWSLCYEEQFYLICGLLLCLTPRRFFWGVGVVSAVTLMMTLYIFWRHEILIRGLFLDGRWLIFAAGVLVYYYVNYASRGQKQLILAILVLGCAAAFSVRLQPLSRGMGVRLMLRAGELYWGAGFAILLCLLHPWDEKIAGCRLLRPLVFCGEMCYSLYLIHWPITKGISHFFDLRGLTGRWSILLVIVPVATGLSLVLARVFYLLVERRFLNPPAAVGCAAPVTVAEPALAPGRSEHMESVPV